VFQMWVHVRTTAHVLSYERVQKKWPRWQMETCFTFCLLPQERNPGFSFVISCWSLQKMSEYECKLWSDVVRDVERCGCPRGYSQKGGKLNILNLKIRWFWSSKIFKLWSQTKGDSIKDYVF